MRAYLSMPSVMTKESTNRGLLKGLTSHLMSYFNLNTLEYWSHGEVYKNDYIKKADMIFVYVSSFDKQKEAHLSYIGKGQYSEVQEALKQKKTIIAIDKHHRFLSVKGIILNNPDDWQYTYGIISLTVMKTVKKENKRKLLLL